MLNLNEFITEKDGKYEISEFGWSYIRNLSRTVVSRYFRYCEIEDLISTSTVDLAWFILNVLINGDPPRNIRNVLFTRARNCCTNTVNHFTKSEPTDNETLNEYQSPYNADDFNLDLEYKFSTRAEAHLLSLKIWKIYNSK